MEATSFVGGRVRGFRFADDLIWDEGAHWLHDVGGPHVLLQQAKKLGLVSPSLSGPNALITKDGKWVNELNIGNKYEYYPLNIKENGLMIVKLYTTDYLSWGDEQFFASNRGGMNVFISLSDKKIVTRKHLIPQITKLMDIHPDEILISDSQIEKIIDDYTREAGARQLKRILENLIQELNLKRLMDSSSSLEITQELVNNVLYNQDKIRHVLICKEPRKIGQIYGMWANALGLGGVLPIQVRRVLDETSGLLLTGTQGDTMKESMKCAKSMAWELLYIHKKPAYIGFLKKKQAKRTSGLQIHCPSTSTPKDGPSAGGAICIAIFSYLSRIPIRTDVAMTGEIDLDGNITAIGGLEAKLNGAKKAGIKIAIIPKENEEQLLRLRNQEKIVEDDDFKVVMVDTVYEAVIFFKE